MVKMLYFLRDDAVRFLINRGLDINEKDDKGNNALVIIMKMFFFI